MVGYEVGITPHIEEEQGSRNKFRTRYIMKILEDKIIVKLSLLTTTRWREITE